MVFQKKNSVQEMPAALITASPPPFIRSWGESGLFALSIGEDRDEDFPEKQFNCGRFDMSGGINYMSGTAYYMSGEAYYMSGTAYYMSGEAYYMSGETYYMSGEAYYMSGETYYMSGETKEPSLDFKGVQ